MTKPAPYNSLNRKLVRWDRAPRPPLLDVRHYYSLTAANYQW